MEIFYYSYQGNTVKSICALQNLCLTYLLFHLILLGITFWYVIANTIKFISSTQIWIHFCEQNLFFSGMKSVIMFSFSTSVCVGKVVVAAFIKET